MICILIANLKEHQDNWQIKHTEELGWKLIFFLLSEQKKKNKKVVVLDGTWNLMGIVDEKKIDLEWVEVQSFSNDEVLFQLYWLLFTDPIVCICTYPFHHIEHVKGALILRWK